MSAERSMLDEKAIAEKKLMIATSGSLILTLVACPFPPAVIGAIVLYGEVAHQVIKLDKLNKATR
jgi:hypothetical protein